MKALVAFLLRLESNIDGKYFVVKEEYLRLNLEGLSYHLNRNVSSNDEQLKKVAQ